MNLSRRDQGELNSGKRYGRVTLIAYAFSFIAFLILLYTLFSSKAELQKQSIQWFYISLVSALIPNFSDFVVFSVIPNLKSVKLQQLEFSFKEAFEQVGAKLEKLDQKTDEIQSNFINAIEAIRFSEEELSDDYKRMRNNVNESYYEREIKNASPNERLMKQRYHTKKHLTKRNVDVLTLKQILKKIGVYQGEANGEIDQALIEAIVQFQTNEKMFPPDGICGVATLKKIYDVYHAKGG